MRRKQINHVKQEPLPGQLKRMPQSLVEQWTLCVHPTQSKRTMTVEKVALEKLEEVAGGSNEENQAA